MIRLAFMRLSLVLLMLVLAAYLFCSPLVSVSVLICLDLIHIVHGTLSWKKRHINSENDVLGTGKL